MAKGKKLSELEKKSRHTIDSAKKEFGTAIKGYAIKWKIKFLLATFEDGSQWKWSPRSAWIYLISDEELTSTMNILTAYDLHYLGCLKFAELLGI